MTSPLDDDRDELTSLHFAQGAMRDHERRTLHLGEAMLRRVDAVLELCDGAERSAGTEQIGISIIDVRQALGAEP